MRASSSDPPIHDGEATAPNGTAAAADANIERGLDRIDPEQILADEADPDVLLGRESDSESNFSKRDSAVSAFSAVSLDSPSDAAGKGAKAAAGTQPVSETPNTPTTHKPGEPAAHRTGGSTPAAAAAVPDTPDTPTVGSVRAAAPAVSAASAAPTSDASAAETIAKLEAHILDLTAQVTGLNEKLVRSFERISDLEDDLSDAHARVSAHSVKVAGLEKEREEHLAALNTGLLVEKAHVSSEMSKLMERVIEETAQRGKAESDKEKIERELDELSASLFAEANRMVAVERLARARAEEKTNNLSQSLKDTEALMLEQRKILESLQAQVDERRDADAGTAAGSAARSGSAAGATSISLRELAPARAFSRSHSTGAVVGSSAAASGSAVLLTNTMPFHEFSIFVQFLRKQRQSLAPFYNYPLYPKGASGSGLDTSADSSHSSSSTSSTGPNPLMMGGLGLSHGLAGALGSASTVSNMSSNYSREPLSPFVAAGLSRHRDYPLLPSNCESMVSISNQLSSIAFLKRAQEEDSDPALRLDLAPALSWLSRRSVQSSILEGTLVIEPVFAGSQQIDEPAIRAQNAHLPPAACALCGTGVVNVPLPTPGEGVGSSGAGHSNGASGSSGSTGWASSISAVTGGGSRKDAGSSSHTPTGSASGTSSAAASSGNLTTKSSLPSLFSSLRLGSSSRKDTTTPPPPSVAENGEPNTDTTTPSSAPPTPIQPAYLPVPTHIFRVTESATQRYLLCPHHCLARLRAVCAFWGYVRTLERSIVLEGKKPWEDGVSGRQPPPLPPRSPVIESAQTSVAFASAAAELKDDKPADTGGDQQEASAPVSSAESEAKAVPESAEPAEKATDADPEAEAEKPVEGGDKDTEAKKVDASNDDANGGDDAPAEAPKTDAAADSVTAEDKTGGVAAVTEDDKRLAASTPTTSTPASPRPNPPPLPTRSTARRAVPAPPEAAAAARDPSPAVRPLPPTALPPPRAAIPMLTGSAALTAASASAVAAGGETHADAAAAHLGWEERAWQEIVKLKEDMWKARVGVRDVDAAV